MAAKIQTHSFRRKSLARDLLSGALGACGFAFYDMLLGEATLSSVPGPVAGLPQVVVRAAEPDDLADLARRDEPGAAERFAVNTALGSHCFVAVQDATALGYAWFNTTVVEFLGDALFPLPPGTLFVHNVFVFPERRGHRVLQQLLAGIWLKGGDAGYRRAACVVDRANLPALAAFQRAGWRFRTAPIVKLPGMKPVLLGARSLRVSEA